MGKKVQKDETILLVEQIVSAMQEKKARNIVSMDLSAIANAVTRFFVVCHAPSKTQVDAIYDNIIEIVRKQSNIKPFNAEGYENSEWILIDYVDVVVHVFQEGIRSFYHLEDLWGDTVLTAHESDD